MNGTAKKIVRQALIGFLIGVVIGNLIIFFTSGNGETALYSQTLLRKTGSPKAAFLMQNLLSGLLGAVSMAGSIFYELDDWEMSRAAVTHYLLSLGAYFAIAFFCGWIKPDWSQIFIMIIIMTAAYFLIWLIMYLLCRKEAEELDRALRMKKTEEVGR